MRPLTTLERLRQEKGSSRARNSKEQEKAELGFFQRIPPGAGEEFVFDVRSLLFCDASVQYAYLRYTLRESWARHALALFILAQQSFLSIAQQQYWRSIIEPDEVSDAAVAESATRELGTYATRPRSQSILRSSYP